MATNTDLLKLAIDYDECTTMSFSMSVIVAFLRFIYNVIDIFWENQDDYFSFSQQYPIILSYYSCSQTSCPSGHADP